MKTAEEWMQYLDPNRHDKSCCYSPVPAEDIKQIQLDAIKEGMRRAAKLDSVTPIKDADGEIRYRWSEYGEAITDYEKAILSAAEQLTVNDLCPQNNKR